MQRGEHLQLDVMDTLAQAAVVDSSKIAVTATDLGEVTLTGATTQEQASVAEQVARRVRGVRGVVNAIDTGPGSRTGLEDPSETAVPESGGGELLLR